jgi:hypothetical protein
MQNFLAAILLAIAAGFRDGDQQSRHAGAGHKPRRQHSERPDPDCVKTRCM